MHFITFAILFLNPCPRSRNTLASLLVDRLFHHAGALTRKGQGKACHFTPDTLVG